jgi:hypothetical protein
MTDEEMALAIGEKILNLYRERAIMVGILDNIIMPDGSRLDWRPMMKDDTPSLASSPVSQEKSDELRESIFARSGHCSALEQLYQHFLGN